MKTTRLLILVFGSILIASSASAKPWRGIVPLRSNCEDVKRLLGHASCKADWFKLPNENVFITFSGRHCDGNPISWDVPIGTVLSIHVNPKNKPKLSDLIENPNRFTQTLDEHVSDVVYYTDKEEGFTLQVFSNGEVGSLHYGPSAEDMKLRCSGAIIDTGLPDGAQKFDEFGELKSRKEKIRLNYFASELRARPIMRGYIVVHSITKRSRDWRVTADRIKKYLVVHQHLSQERLFIVKGREEQNMIQLYVAPPITKTEPNAR